MNVESLEVTNSLVIDEDLLFLKPSENVLNRETIEGKLIVADTEEGKCTFKKPFVRYAEPKETQFLNETDTTTEINAKAGRVDISITTPVTDFILTINNSYVYDNSTIIVNSASHNVNIESLSFGSFSLRFSNTVAFSGFITADFIIIN